MLPSFIPYYPDCSCLIVRRVAPSGGSPLRVNHRAPQPFPPSAINLVHGPSGSGSNFHRFQSLLELTGVALFRLRQRFEPVSELVEAFIAGGAGHTGKHVGIFLVFTLNRPLTIGAGVAEPPLCRWYAPTDF